MMVLHGYHFMIKELAEEFQEQFECLGENTEKYISFSVPVKKGLDNIKPVTYQIKFIDSFGFIASIANNLSDGLHCDKCIDRKSCLDYMSVKDDQLVFR